MRTSAALFAALVALSAVAAHAAADAFGLNELMQMLGTNRARDAAFTERHYFKLVDKPLESSGELSYAPPRWLQKHTLKPRDESLTVDGEELSLARAGHRRVHLDLREHPEIAAFVDSIRGTLAGDLQSLEGIFRVEVSGSANAWQLALTPLDPKMAQAVARVRIGGAEGEIRLVTFEFSNGDRSEMTISAKPAP